MKMVLILSNRHKSCYAMFIIQECGLIKYRLLVGITIIVIGGITQAYT